MTKTHDGDHQCNTERERGDQRVIYILVVASTEQADKDEEQRANLDETNADVPRSHAVLLRIRQ